MKTFHGKGFKNIYNKLFLPSVLSHFPLLHWWRLQGHDLGWCFLAVNGVGSDLFISLRVASPSERVRLNCGGLSPPLCFSECRAGALIPSTSSQSPLWQGQVSKGPGTGRKGWFISGIKTGLFFIFPSLLESTKRQISCPGFWSLPSHRIFHRVHSLAHVVWKDLNFVTKAFGGCGKNGTYIYTTLISEMDLLVITHFNDEHNVWCIIKF